MHTPTVESMDTRGGVKWFAYCKVCKACTGGHPTESAARGRLEGKCEPVKRKGA